MHRITPSPIPVLLFVFSFFFCSVDSTVSFSNCNQTFNCGSLRNISYPFTGGDRPSHCGPPEFRLSCVGDSPELTVDSLSYRVLELDPVFQTLSLARLDLWNETCPKDFRNTTIDYGVFSYGTGNSDLTMFYKCNASVLSMTPVNQFHCDTNGSSNDSYFLVGPIPYDPILNIIQCNESIRVPILEETALDLTNNRSLLGEALMWGFNVNYSIPDADQCYKCLDSGGQCGFDSSSNESICICGDQPCSVSGRSSSKFPLVIAIAGAVSGIIIFSTIILCYYKRECMLSIIARVFRKDTSKEFDVEDFIRNYESISTKRYSYARVKKMTNSFTEKIGSGGFGAVYKGKLPDGRSVAVKILRNSKGDGEEFINEVASIGRTSHVNIVTLLGFCYERNKRALIYAYMPNGSLEKFIFKQGSNVDANCSLEWETLYRIAVGIARGLQYLHQGCNTRILHFDIKPQNILLDDDFCPKISDFGLAKLWLKKESIMSMVGARGTIGYIAPEVFSRNFGGVSHKSDVYSYGMLVLEMVGGRKNFDSTVSRASEIYYPNRIYKDLELGDQASILGVTAEEEKEIIRKMVLVSFWCIQTNPSDRPSMSKVVEMLEGSLEFLEIPPKPCLFSPSSSPQESTTGPSLTKVVEMLEGSVESLQIPPNSVSSYTEEPAPNLSSSSSSSKLVIEVDKVC